MKPIEQDVLETIRSAVKIALAAASTAGNLNTVSQVIVGWPTSTEITKILSQAQSQVSIYPLAGGKQDTRYAAECVTLASPNVPLIANVSGSTITFSGSVIAGLNVHSFVGSPLADAYFQSAIGDDLNAIATKTRDAINALALSGVSASATGANVSVTGSPYISCNVGASVVPLAREAQLLQSSVQVSVWCPDPNTRYAMIDPILASIGTTDNSFLTLSNGMSMRIQFSGRQNWNNDKLQLSYSCYQAHLVYDVEYYALSSVSGSQVESTKENFSINNATAQIFIAD